MGTLLWALALRASSVSSVSLWVMAPSGLVPPATQLRLLSVLYFSW